MNWDTLMPSLLIIKNIERIIVHSEIIFAFLATNKHRGNYHYIFQHCKNAPFQTISPFVFLKGSIFRGGCCLKETIARISCFHLSQYHIYWIWLLPLCISQGLANSVLQWIPCSSGLTQSAVWCGLWGTALKKHCHIIACMWHIMQLFGERWKQTETQTLTFGYTAKKSTWTLFNLPLRLSQLSGNVFVSRSLWLYWHGSMWMMPLTAAQSGG